MKNKKFLFHLLSYLVFFVFFSNAAKAESIIISKKKSELLAPEGYSYQWYKDGIVIDNANNQELSISVAGKYSVVYTNNDNIEVKNEISVDIQEGKIVRIFLIGDSTMTDYSTKSNYETHYYPITGWGEKLNEFLTADSLYKIANIIEADSITIINKAIGGRSSRSFWQEGSWAEVQNQLMEGDYVFIQFGHNDAANCNDYPERCTSIPEYKEYLGRYVDSSRAKGAIPILITPINRNYKWNNGVLSNIHGLYPGTMKEVAKEKNVPLIDGTQRSLDFFNKMGKEYTTSHYFMVFDAGDYPNYRVTDEYPNGSPSDDNTHFQQEGAFEVARLMFEGLQDLVQIKVENENPESATVTGGGWFERKYDSVTVLSVYPNMGWRFMNWSGDISGSENPLELSFNSSKTINANFETTTKPQYIVTASVEGNASATVSPFGGLIEEGEEVSIDLLVDQGNLLYSWVGDLHEQSNPLTFNIEENTNVMAVVVADNAHIFEAELAQINSGQVENNGKNFCFDGFVSPNASDSLSVTWSVPSTEAKSFPFSYRYAYSGESQVSVHLYINDVLSSKTVGFPTTENADVWSYTYRVYLGLESGNNEIKMVLDNVSDSLKIDFLQIRGDLGTSYNMNPSNDKAIKVYPNPVAYFLNIDVAMAVNDIYIYNNLGKLVVTKTNLHDDSLSIDVSALPKGIYFVKTSCETTENGIKFIKQ